MFNINEFTSNIFMKKTFLIFLFFPFIISAQKGKINFEIDHINIVVKDLLEAKNYISDKLGFSVKPGKLHENSIDNIFIKFADKSYIELLTAIKEKDELSKYYFQLAREFPAGTPVYLFLRVNTEEELIILERNILQSGIESVTEDIGYAKLISFDDDDLYNLIIIYYKSPVEDLPKYFTHENSAASLSSVWIDINNSDLIIKKLRLLGLNINDVNSMPIGDFSGYKAELKNKSIYFSNFPNDIFIYGITIGVKSLNKAVTHLTNKTNYLYDILISSRGSRTLLNPRVSFGMWIEILQK